MFETFLQAQETSPTLVLVHAGLRDEGALEIAHFLASSQHLLQLDLSGNGITSTGLLHLAKAIKLNLTLESLVLRHNQILEGGNAGLVALCRVLCGNRTMRHLDLRHNGLSGPEVARCIGEMLQGNSSLTHLELSWNPLTPAGGQCLLDHLTMNTMLFDCQLTGCQVAEETLLAIAQLLLRNRKSKGADMQAGPYRGLRGSADGRNSGLPTRELEECPRGAEPDATARSHGMVVSMHHTRELVDRLLVWRAARRAQQPGQGSECTQEFLELLDRLQRELEQHQEAGQAVRKRTELAIQGFQDREMRYRGDMAAAQDRLLGFANEQKDLRAILDRRAQELALLREATNEAKQSLKNDRQRYEAEEARAKNDLATVTAERAEVAEVLKGLEEHSARQEQENIQLRRRAENLRADVVVLQS